MGLACFSVLSFVACACLQCGCVSVCVAFGTCTRVRARFHVFVCILYFYVPVSRESVSGFGCVSAQIAMYRAR